MQIKNENVRQDASAQTQAANKKNKTKKPSTTSSTAGASTTFSRVAKAAALGVLAGPSVVSARQTPSPTSNGLALPGHGSALVNPHTTHASRQLLQTSCGCGLSVGSQGSSFAYAGTGYSKIALQDHTRGNTVVLTTSGSTVDVTGFLPIDGVGVETSQALDHGVFSTSNGAAIVFVPQGQPVSASTTGRLLVNLIGFAPSQVASSDSIVTGIPSGPACATTLVGSAPVAGGALACSPPPAPPPPPSPIVFVAPPPPTPVPVSPSPVFASPSPVPVSPSPVFASPSPVSPSPVFASPSPVVASPSPVVDSPTPIPTPEPTPTPIPTPSPKGGSGGGAGAAIGGIAGGVGAAVVAGGAYFFHRRRKAQAQATAEQREQNVEMGAPTPAPAAPAEAAHARPATPEADFEYTV